MCGLVAVYGDVSLNDRKIFKQLLQVDVLRGKHSTGVIGVNRKGEVMTHKSAVSGTPFLEEKETQAVIDHGSRCLIGHNRYATMGAVNAQNAHPFSHGDVHLVHNGTLVEQEQLPDWQEFEVDSENICHAVNKIGAKEAFEKTAGAFACIWFDESDQTMNFTRNDERPLWKCAIVNRQGKVNKLYLASEREMLYWILDRNGIQFDGDYKEYFTEIPTLQLNKVRFLEEKAFNYVSQDAPIPFEEAKVTSYRGWGGYGGLDSYESYGSYGNRSYSGSHSGNVTNIETALDGKNNLMKYLGYEQGDYVPAMVDKFTPYKNNEVLGTLRLHMLSAPYSCLVCYNVDRPTDDFCMAELRYLYLDGHLNKGVDPLTTPEGLQVQGGKVRVMTDKEVKDYVTGEEVTEQSTVQCSACDTEITHEMVLNRPPMLVQNGNVSKLHCADCWDEDTLLRDMVKHKGFKVQPYSETDFLIDTQSENKDAI